MSRLAAPNVMFELKCEIGKPSGRTRRHVNASYLRLREIQSPAFQGPAIRTCLPAWTNLCARRVRVGSLGYRVRHAESHRALEIHWFGSFPNNDQPSVHVIKHALLDVRAQIERIGPPSRPHKPAK